MLIILTPPVVGICVPGAAVCTEVLLDVYESIYDCFPDNKMRMIYKKKFSDVATDKYLGDDRHGGLGSEHRGIQHCRQSSGSDNGRQHGRQILKLQHLVARRRISRYAYTVSTSDIHFIAMKIYANFK